VMNRQLLLSQLERLVILNDGYDAVLSALEELLREGYPVTSSAVKTARQQLEIEQEQS
jgi:hypothetical protein